MNRTLTNVLFGGISAPVGQAEQKIEGTITKTNVDDTVESLLNSENVILVRVAWFRPRSTKKLTSHNPRHRQGCWIWDGRRQGSIRHLGRRQDAAVQGYQRSVCHPSCGWKVSSPWCLSTRIWRALTLIDLSFRMPGQCNVLLAEASVPYDSALCHSFPSAIGFGALMINAFQSCLRWTKSTTTSTRPM